MLLALTLIGLSLVTPLLVLAQSGSWRTAWEAWWKSTAVIAALAIPGLLVQVFAAIS